MESIRIGKIETSYPIKSIVPVSSHVLKIEFDDAIPTEFGEILVYTAGGIQCSYLPGFATVYKKDGQTVWLSDDSSVYVEPVTPEPVTPVEPTLDEVKSGKRSEIKSACESIITKGVDVTLSDGSTGHFALTQEDQLNLFGKQVQIYAGATEIEYHEDGQLCKYFAAADMQKIIKAAMFFVSYHTTYCNSIINGWLPACTTKAEVAAITYGSDIPEAYQSDVLKAYLKEIADASKT